MEFRLQRSVIVATALAAVIAATVSAKVGGGEAPANERVIRAELRAISTKLEGAVSTVMIESSEPVAYVTSSPDPLTVIVDLRNVEAGQLPPGLLGPLPPVSNVRVEEAMAGDGATVARVRVSLAHAAKHRVRSSRNVIYVEVDRAVVPRSGPAAIAERTATAPVTAAPAAPAARAARRAATALRSVRALNIANGVGISIVGNGELIAANVEEARDLPPRLLLDFRGVSARGVPAVTEIRSGIIQRVRVGTNSVSPLVTRVVIDLARRQDHRIAYGGANGEELQVLFEDAPASARSDSATSFGAASPTPAPAANVARPGPGASQTLPVLTAGAAAATLSPSTPSAPSVPSAPSTGAPQQPLPVAPGTQAAAPAPPAPIMSDAPPASQDQQPPPSRFTGHTVSLDFQGADLRSVLRTFADISGLNIVIDPTINGTVDVALRDVPWDQALDIILKANKLGYAIDGTVVRIAPLNVLAQEQEEERKLTDAKALSGELRVLTLPLSYAKAPELVSILTRSALSARGEVQVDTRTNTLIVRDLADRLTTAAELIKTLDRPQPQVEIEARIVQTTRDFARAIGVQWGFNGRVDPTLGTSTPLAFPNNGSIRGGVGGAQGPLGPETGINLAAPAATSAIGIALGAVNGAVNLDVVLSQLESTGRGRLLSTPRISTQNNIEAEMTQGVQIPIQTVANNTVTVSFKDAALTLRVTPQITAANTIIMRVNLENATPDFSRAINGIPPIDTQRAVTTVLVADGETTVIGGIYVSVEQVSQDRVPLLHRVPLLGWLFKRDEVGDTSRELLIFITPRITRS